jgi:hypothetical protein
MPVLIISNSDVSKEVSFDFSSSGQLYLRLIERDSALNIWIEEKDVNVLRAVLNSLTIK